MVEIFGPLFVVGALIYFFVPGADKNFGYTCLFLFILSIILFVEFSVMLSGESMIKLAEVKEDSKDGQAEAIEGSPIKASVAIYLDVVSAFVFIISMFGDS